MIIHFSETTKGFYRDEWQAEYQARDNWPSDAVQLTEEELTIFWKQLPPAGQVLGAVKGRPSWLDLPPPAPLTSDELAATARQYRDAFIIATDPMMVSDYCIDDIPLTTPQRDELTNTRARYRAWPTLENWPLIELPELPQWLLVEAVNQGYRVPVWS